MLRELQVALRSAPLNNDNHSCRSCEGYAGLNCCSPSRKVVTLAVMVKFLHTADWQLGMARHYLGHDAQARFSGARLDVIEQMAQLATNEQCEFVVVCGDVFESNQVQRQVLVRAFEKMAAFPKLSFFLLPGNHDPLDASSIYTSPTFIERCPANVKVLTRFEPVQAAPGVELIAAPWPNKHPTTDLVEAACGTLEQTSSLRIVVGHGAIDSMSPDPNDPKVIALDRLEEQIQVGLIHYVALGDRHSTTNVGTTGRVYYSGAPEPTDYDEIDPGNVLIIDLGADHVDVVAKHLGTWRFLRRDWQLTSDRDIDALEEWLSGLEDKDRTIVKVSMVGQLSVAQKARLDELLEHHADLLAAIETWERHSDLVVIPDDADLDHFGLSGFASQALTDLHTMAEQGDQAPVARDALALLYRLVGSRS